MLVLSPDDRGGEGLAKRLKAGGINLEIVRGMPPRQPSYLAQFVGVVSLWKALPADMVRELLVRGIEVVAVDHEPQAYSVNTVLLDRAGGVVRSARELVALGHTRIAIMEREGMPEMAPALRSASKLLGPLELEVYKCVELADMARSTATAMVVKSMSWAERLVGKLHALGRHAPEDVSVMMVGLDDTETGEGHAGIDSYRVSNHELAEAIIAYIKGVPTTRPMSLWLTTTRHAGKTLGPPPCTAMPYATATMPGALPAGLSS
jgi:hypothetical protein